MLLGQIVAISFASNLFFIAVLVHERVSRPSAAKPGEPEPAVATTAAFWFDPIVTSTVGLAVAIPAAYGKPHFIYMLLAPHVMAFLPIVLDRLLPRETPADMQQRPTVATGLGAMVAIVAFATLAVLEGGGDWAVIYGALNEHPAVSSVGWDVICCWVSYGAWCVLGEP